VILYPPLVSYMSMGDAEKAGAENEGLGTRLTLGTHYPCSRAVDTARETRVVKRCRKYGEIRFVTFDQPESIHQTAFRSVQPFLHSLRHRVSILYNRPPLYSSKLSSHMGIWLPSNTSFLGPTRVHNPRSVQPFLQGSRW